MRAPSRRAGLLRLATITFVASIVAACGSDPKQPAPETHRSTVVESPDTDAAIAGRANLVAGDLPSGWNSRPHEERPGEKELGPGIAVCLGITPPSGRATAQVRSEDFTQGLATVSSVVTVVSSVADAAADAAAYSSEKFAECLKPGYEAQAHAVAPEGNTVTEAATTRLELAPVGDRISGVRFSAKIIVPDPGITIPVFVDIVHIFKGRVEVELVVTAPGSAFPDGFTSGLAAAIAGRL